jgi:hypothetical protein
METPQWAPSTIDKLQGIAYCVLSLYLLSYPNSLVLYVNNKYF